MAVGACRMSRCCLEDAIRRGHPTDPTVGRSDSDDSRSVLASGLCDRYARIRKVFGKPWIQQQASWAFRESGWRVVAVIALYCT